jgi:Mg-chelatase subunit ChlD
MRRAAFVTFCAGLLALATGAALLFLRGPGILRAQTPPGESRQTLPSSRLRGRVVFLVDASGSMRIPDQVNPEDKARPPVSRLASAVWEVSQTLRGLLKRGRHEFDIVAFGSESRTFSATVGEGPRLLPLDRSRADAAGAFLGRLRASGPTRLLKALKAAFALFPEEPEPGVSSTVFLYTDGVHTFGKEEPSDDIFRMQIQSANTRGVKINTFAVGATSISRKFLRTLALAGDGISLSRRNAPWN